MKHVLLVSFLALLLVGVVAADDIDAAPTTECPAEYVLCADLTCAETPEDCSRNADTANLATAETSTADTERTSPQRVEASDVEEDAERDLSETRAITREGDEDEGNNGSTGRAQYGNEHGVVLTTHSCPIHGYSLDIVRPSGYAEGTTWRIIDAHKTPKAFYADWTEVQNLVANHQPSNLYYEIIQPSNEADGDYCDRDGQKLFNTNVYQVYLDHYNDYNSYTPKLDDSNLETAPLNLVIQSYNQNRNQGDALPPTCNYGCNSGGGVDPTEPDAPNPGGLDFGDDPRDTAGWVDDLFPSSGNGDGPTRPDVVEADGAVDVRQNPNTTPAPSGDRPELIDAKAETTGLIKDGGDVDSDGDGLSDLSEENEELRRGGDCEDGNCAARPNQRVEELKRLGIPANHKGLTTAAAASNNTRVREILYDEETNETVIHHRSTYRVLGLFSVDADTETRINAEGEMRAKKPWWSFLAGRDSDSDPMLNVEKMERAR